MLDLRVGGHTGDAHPVVRLRGGDARHVRTVPPGRPPRAPVPLVLRVRVTPVAVPRVVGVGEEVVAGHRLGVEVRVVDLASVRNADHHALTGALPPRVRHADVARAPLVVPVRVVRGGGRCRGERPHHDLVGLRGLHGRVGLDSGHHVLLLRRGEHGVRLHDILTAARGPDRLRPRDVSGLRGLSERGTAVLPGHALLVLHHEPVRLGEHTALPCRPPAQGGHSPGHRRLRLRGLLSRRRRSIRGRRSRRYCRGDHCQRHSRRDPTPHSCTAHARSSCSGPGPVRRGPERAGVDLVLFWSVSMCIDMREQTRCRPNCDGGAGGTPPTRPRTTPRS